MKILIHMNPNLNLEKSSILSKSDFLCPLAIMQRGYSIGANIGGGTFSKVYKASYNGLTGRQLAVKVIFLNKVSNEWKQKCLKKELQIIRELQHPNIIRVMEIIKTQRRVFIFMEYAENNSIYHYLQENNYVVEYQARVWFSQAASALCYMHCKNIAHRDLKNENILLDRDLNAKLTDFGFSCYTYSDEIQKSITSPTCCGTLGYIAPEVFEPPYDAKVADIWSFGICLYEMICNAKPFNTNLTIKMYIQSQKRKSWRFTPNVENKLSNEVKDLIVRMLEPNTSLRIKMTDMLSHPWIIRSK